MLLPPALFEPISAHFAHHTVWHAARLRGQDELRKTLPGECNAALAGIHEVGSGCDFLRFHRRMIQHFLLLLENVKPSAFRWRPWDGPRLPSWVEEALLADRPSFDLEEAYGRIRAFINAGDVENLGGFIESNELWRGERGASLHNRVHVAIDRYECAMYCGDETSPMRDLGQSPGNVFFWLLHDWIDRRYAECQEAVKDEVDRSPRVMHVDIHRVPSGVTLKMLD